MYVVHNYNKPSGQVYYPKTLVVEHMHAILHNGKYRYYVDMHIIIVVKT